MITRKDLLLWVFVVDLSETLIIYKSTITTLCVLQEKLQIVNTFQMVFQLQRPGLWMFNILHKGNVYANVYTVIYTSLNN